MRIQFFYNDGQGYDEHGVEQMNLVNKGAARYRNNKLSYSIFNE
jgi:hypothetical protein